MSNIQKALQQIENNGMSVADAAKQFKLTKGYIYSARSRFKTKATAKTLTTKTATTATPATAAVNAAPKYQRRPSAATSYKYNGNSTNAAMILEVVKSNLSRTTKITVLSALV